MPNKIVTHPIYLLHLKCGVRQPKYLSCPVGIFNGGLSVLFLEKGYDFRTGLARQVPCGPLPDRAVLVRGCEGVRFGRITCGAAKAYFRSSLGRGGKASA